MLVVWCTDSRKPMLLNEIPHPPQPRPNVCRQRLDLGRYRRIQDFDGPSAHAEIDIE